MDTPAEVANAMLNLQAAYYYQQDPDNELSRFVEMDLRTAYRLTVLFFSDPVLFDARIDEVEALLDWNDATDAPSRNADELGLDRDEFEQLRLEAVAGRDEQINRVLESAPTVCPSERGTAGCVSVHPGVVRRSSAGE